MTSYAPLSQLVCSCVALCCTHCFELIGGVCFGCGAQPYVDEKAVAIDVSASEMQRLSSASPTPHQPTAEAAAAPRVCRICGSGEDPHLLISPCNCSGSLEHVHTTCLQMWISTRPQRNAALNAAAVGASPHGAALALVNGGGGAGGGRAGDDQKLVCEICHAHYRLTIQYTFKFEWSRCARCDSLGHVFELGGAAGHARRVCGAVAYAQTHGMHPLSVGSLLD
jgi:hypothetical protein